MTRTLALTAAVTALLVAGCSATSVGTGTDTPGATPPGTSGDSPAAEDPPAEEELTKSQENAIGSAESYLELSGFSKAGLIKQLSSNYGEGYPKKDAIFAVEYLDVDWNKQAVRSAKSYLETSNFSCSGLVDQLSSSYGEQFTKAQAKYAAKQVGLC